MQIDSSIVREGGKGKITYLWSMRKVGLTEDVESRGGRRTSTPRLCRIKIRGRDDAPSERMGWWRLSLLIYENADFVVSVVACIINYARQDWVVVRV